MPAKYRCKYEYTIRHGQPEHLWSVIGANAGMHLWIRSYKCADADEQRHSGGIEIHHRYPPEYRLYDAPDHDECWLLKSPCWHDGSSLAASEIWIPRWQRFPNDHDFMFKALCDDLDSREVGGVEQMLANIAAMNSQNPILANFEQGVRDGLAAAEAK